MVGYEVLGSHEHEHGHENGKDDWIPLMDYAMKTGISLSTLRRQIKAKKIQYKIENGRYLLLDSHPGLQSASQPEVSALRSAPVASMPAVQASLGANVDLHKAQLELRRAREEIAELKTLIAFYEEKMFSSRPDGQA